ncbi:eukaryotic elongation factor 2 kinase-like [Clytia hemisphaerica]|uniref:eukaryotic elongation factor 2 kinase-like n=1 Tax=Clytia hemisphaerica TaxID=252671 RepID=UPI0034D49371
MIKCGKMMKPFKTLVEIEHFNVQEMKWDDKRQLVEFQIDEKPFGKGTFRAAFMANSSHNLFKGKKWVAKKYQKQTVDDLKDLDLDPYQHGRKLVQMHSLAKNLAESFTRSITSIKFGTVSYNEVYFGILDGKVITVEEFASGKFVKYVNNNGEICKNVDKHGQSKAEAFVHFTYQKSEEKLMVLDIQGCGKTYFDPEIAAGEHFDDQDELLFCGGNLSQTAIKNFKHLHQCNKFCSDLLLTPFKDVDDQASEKNTESE